VQTLLKMGFGGVMGLCVGMAAKQVNSAKHASAVSQAASSHVWTPLFVG